ncbi:interleukin-1 receptor type 1-like [Scleropages formosus]|uniref:interleukin-1 receptor type 1-like n=1 Tax=Scleropages formosus TaxID=113540 RepID=UPI0010FA7B6C|nr:interleukin-1 receptor type 1-like [Scleropages formosus]
MEDCVDSLGPAHCVSPQDVIDTYYAAEGHFYQLECDLHLRHMESNQTITWTKDDNRTLDVKKDRIEMRENFLWFLPVELPDSGFYTCSSGTKMTKMNLLVMSGHCPSQSADKIFQKGTTKKISCGQEHIFSIDEKAEVNWLKECKTMNFHEKHIRLFNVTERNAGKYTCQINFIYEQRRYTASRTILVKIKNEPILFKPKIIRPRQETVQVEPGFKTELNCTVFIGMSESAVNEMLVYWTFNNSFIEQYESKQLLQSQKLVKRENNKMYVVSILSVMKVQPEFFLIPFCCIATNPVGKDVGQVQLIPASPRSLCTYIAICLPISVIAIVLTICFFFKVDIVLTFRRLCCILSKKTPDGKLYDAYVSYIYGNLPCTSQVEHFVTQVLPEVLERRYAYKLFITGRDNLPGEAVHDTIADTIKKSRMMIIVLSAVNLSDLVQVESMNQDQPRFEQQIGLYDALIKDNLKVILVELDKNVDYSLFPESVRYIKKKQGAIRWRQNRGDAMAAPNRHFWKLLRYHMSEPISSLTIPWHATDNRDAIV